MNTLQIDSVLLDEALKMAKQKNIDLTQMVESFIAFRISRRLIARKHLVHLTCQKNRIDHHMFC